MNNYKLILQYDGSRYRGWQVQGNTDATIQGKLQQVLERITGESIELAGSGRTDAGVHALGQVANFKCNKYFEPEQLVKELNRYLPEDIAVLRAEPVDLRFHSRLSAVDKTYCYQICNSDKADVFARKYQTLVEEPLDVSAMERAAGYLLGEHDFTSFCGNRHLKKSARRRVDELRVERDGKIIRITIRGNGFLQNMVRIIVGTLVEVGAGRREAETVGDILAAKDRSMAGPTMAAKGLALVEVRYSRVNNGKVDRN
ncbi:MAG: tRNA pseudouridine(38-40) synthase TruA [Roseburia sp.]